MATVLSFIVLRANLSFRLLVLPQRTIMRTMSAVVDIRFTSAILSTGAAINNDQLVTSAQLGK